VRRGGVARPSFAPMPLSGPSSPKSAFVPIGGTPIAAGTPPTSRIEEIASWQN
jgi:hypothetical protein